MPLLRVNPDFDASPEELARDLDRMARSPRPLERPVVVLAGWRSPACTPGSLARRLRELTSGNRSDFLVLAYPLTGDFERIVTHVRARVAARFPGEVGGRPAPVDVVAISMGGLVARAAAIDRFASGPTLGMARLFTLSTPHRGASLARRIRPDSSARVMQPGSGTLATLDEALPSRTYELICYGQPRDWWIGDDTQAPAGMPLLWADVRTPLFAPVSHFTVNRNELIIADIARRLRGEAPIAR
jgi:hypothetical protein